MIFFRFDKEIGFPIKRYDSLTAHFITVLRSKEETSVGFIHIEAGGVVGYHQASVQQLFIVVQGGGWVTGTNREKMVIESGEGVMWEEGEWHESGSESGMLALVIESESIDTSHLQDK